MHSNFFQLGRLHIPVFGVFAAIGLMAALALSQRTARHARLGPDAVWNAGMSAVVSAFIISRILLVVFNWHSFLQYPVLVLALPSLTSTGVLLTGLVMLGYLQWRRLPLLPFVDAMAPCLSLLWAFLSAGRFVEGTRDGMPMRLAQGMRGGSAATVQPVEIYTLVSAAVICLVLLRALQRVAKPGRTAGIGLVLTGVAVYCIDFFRLPSDLLSSAWLDLSQALAIVVAVIGGVLAVAPENKIERAQDQRAISGSEGPDAV